MKMNVTNWVCVVIVVLLFLFVCFVCLLFFLCFLFVCLFCEGGVNVLVCRRCVLVCFFFTLI